MGGPILALFDANVLDWLHAQPTALQMVREAMDGDRLRLVSTHILDDELAATPDPQRRTILEALGRQLGSERVATRGFVFGLSRIGQAALSSEADARLFETLSVRNPKNAEDALLALTADREGAVLVTRDMTLRNRANRRRIEAIHPSELLRRLR